MGTVQYYKGDARQQKESEEKRNYTDTEGEHGCKGKRLKKETRSTLMASWTRKGCTLMSFLLTPGASNCEK